MAHGSLSTHRIKQIVVESIVDVQDQLTTLVEQLEAHKQLIVSGSNLPNDTEQKLRVQTMETVSLLRPNITKINQIMLQKIPNNSSK